MDEPKGEAHDDYLEQIGLTCEQGLLKRKSTGALLTVDTLITDPLQTIQAITKYVQNNIRYEYEFEEIRVPLETDVPDNDIQSSIFVSSNFMKAKSIFMIISNSGTYPGVWSRSLCVEGGIEQGTMIPYIRQALERRYGVIILNPFMNSVKIIGDKQEVVKRSIPLNETPEAHALYVWDHILNALPFQDICIMAYGYGGVIAKYLLQAREKQLIPRLKAFALTESLHTFREEILFDPPLAGPISPESQEFMQTRCINWGASDQDNGKRICVMEKKLGCICISIGHAHVSNNLAYTNYLAMESIFKWFEFACQDNGDNLMFVDAYYRNYDVLSLPYKVTGDASVSSSFPAVFLKPADVWQADHEYTFCQVCMCPFSFFNRRHHCRLCGKIVCNKCSKYRMKLYKQDRPTRVCRLCYFANNKEAQAPQNASHSTLNLASSSLSKNDFTMLKVVGKGSFGKVLLVRSKINKKVYALKILSKEKVVERKQVDHTKSERIILEMINYPFLARLEFAFQTHTTLYLGMEFFAGGPLFHHLQQARRFPEERARFYACEVILAMGYLHKENILYRDMKPENILLDRYGHVYITDFGLSKLNVNKGQMVQTICGTPEYVAPEVLLGNPYGKAVDWWSIGTLLYEMMVGLPPFYDKNRKTMFTRILSAKLRFPAYVSANARNLIARLLQRDPALRLGSGPTDAEEIKAHPFFMSVDWKAIEEKRVTPPWIPQLIGDTDTRNFNQKYTYAEVDEGTPPTNPNVDYPSFDNFDYERPPENN
ncbi:hypothetical protein WA158_004427 [Blastocystis sp. Blastoise]